MHETSRSANYLGHHQHNMSADELSLAVKEGSQLKKKVTGHDAHCGGDVHLALSMPSYLGSLPVIDCGGSIVMGSIDLPASIFQNPPSVPNGYAASKLVAKPFS
jgi:hypothetical protein